MPPVSVSLYEVACTCAGTRSNHSALLTAYQASAYRADHSADNGPLSLAVVMSVGALVSQPLGGKCQHNKNEHQQHRYNVLFSISLYHYHPLLRKEKLSVFSYSINHSTLICQQAMWFLFTNGQFRKYNSTSPVTQLLQS